jgi:gliding motility-associated-like protein
LEGIELLLYQYLGKTKRYRTNSEANNPETEVTDIEFGTSIFRYTINNGFCPEVSDTMMIDSRPMQQTNGFSPNGDGINDVFVIRGIENTLSNRLVVFNNWGDVVYESDNYQNDWDGTKRGGGELPSDTYYFVLSIPELGDYSGYLILKR